MVDPSIYWVEEFGRTNSPVSREVLGAQSRGAAQDSAKLPRYLDFSCTSSRTKIEVPLQPTYSISCSNPPQVSPLYQVQPLLAYHHTMDSTILPPASHAVELTVDTPSPPASPPTNPSWVPYPSLEEELHSIVLTVARGGILQKTTDLDRLIGRIG